MRRILTGIIAALLFLNSQAAFPPDAKDSPAAAMEDLDVAIQGTDPAGHVISHRGASGEAREHTFDAYDLAIEYGTRFIELDVVVSANGTIYVSHDFSPYRLTGVDKEYMYMTDQEIDALRTSDGYPILRLESVFQRYGTSVNYVIELKRPVETADILARLLKKYDLGKNTIIQCARVDVIRKLKKSISTLRFIVSVHDDDEMREALKLSFVDIILVESSLMTMRYCLAAHESGKQFAVWTLNDRDAIVRAIALGVDYYYTNYTALALALEARYRGRIQWETPEKYR